MCHRLLLVALSLGGCAAKTIVVSFPDYGANYPTGTITLTQGSADGALTITTALSQLDADAAGNKWHIHNFPTVEGGGIDGACGPSFTGGHYNPTFQDVANPTPGVETSYEIGDLGGKHGNLGINAATDATTYTDTTASIFYSSASGTKSNMWVMGRSIVIHKAGTGARWACANIGPAGIGATATFTGEGGTPLGSVELFQPSEADATAMTVSLTGLETTGNKWHVHVLPVPGSGDCSATGGHFDPLVADYSAGEFEIGDLSGKWGFLNAPALVNSNDAFVGTGQGYVTDAELPLSGDMSSLGRSIVIHRTDGSRWACATIPMRITVTFPDLGTGYPSGSISLYQEAVDGNLTITTKLINLDGEAAGNKWHVHAFPTDASGGFDQGCYAAVTGGHFNPTFQDVANPVVGDQSSYEVGDLGGKHGNLGLGSTADGEIYMDSQASILYDPTQQSRGSMWIVGRSIVIHKAADSARWACANIGSAGIGTTATFAGANSEPSGTVQLFQPSPFWPTGVLVDLAASSLETTGNKWHVHVLPVPGSGDCSATGGHFDPLVADYSAGEFEIGDLSGKWGFLNAPALVNSNDAFVGTGQGYVTDAELPLSGDMSSLGRSIVIHRTDGSRWACADLAPRSHTATFNVLSGPEGYIEIFQPSATSTAVVSVNLQGLGSGEKSWHVHQLAAPSGNGDATGAACDSTAAHFNPSFGTGVAEDGDLAARHGQFSEATSRMFVEDSLVTLWGNNSVVGRSIVIHRTSGERWGCASIGPAGRGYTLSFPDEGADYPEGTVQLFQKDEAAVTTITVSLSRMPTDRAGGFDLRNLAVPGHNRADKDAKVCGSLGGVYEGEGGGSPKAGELDQLYGGLTGVGATYTAQLHVGATDLPLWGDDDDTIDGKSVVIRKEVGGEPWVCATVGVEANTTLEALEYQIELLSIDVVELSAAWMRLGARPLCGVATGALAAIATVLLVPGVLQALVVGYMWTYAFGATEGWPLAAVSLWVGSGLGALIAYALGKELLHKLFAEQVRAKTFLARAENAMQNTPVRLLVLLRLMPLVPFNVFNYYVGATFRFTIWHNCASLLATFPGCVIWTGIGAAWHKSDLISWGQAQPKQYVASIWTGISLTIVFVVLGSASAFYVLWRAEKGAREAPEGKAINGTEVAIEIGEEGAGKKKRGLFGRKKGPPPKADPGSPKPPASARVSVGNEVSPGGSSNLQDGWREVCGDDGDVYFYNDETGESQWEAPLKSDTMAIALTSTTPPAPPPPMAPPAIEYNYEGSEVAVQPGASQTEMMAE